jgi:uncharacterized protein YecT (DUF1311 family)
MVSGLILLAALAVQPTSDPEESACYDRDHSQQAMNICAGEAFQRADGDLNRMWREIQSHYSGDADMKKLLLEGQRSWLKYRDAQCELTAYDSRGGSMWPMVISGCRADITRRRVQELKDMLGEGE